MDHQPDAGGAVDLRAFHLGNEVCLVRRELSESVTDDALDGAPDLRHGEKHADHLEDHGRPHHSDLRVTADNNGVGVVARMAPAPDSRFTHDHEAGQLVDRVVHPRGLECRSVTALMPTRVG